MHNLLNEIEDKQENELGGNVMVNGDADGYNPSQSKTDQTRQQQLRRQTKKDIEIIVDQEIY